MRALWTLPVGLVAAGVVLIADAVARGAATMVWVLVVPVVSGGSLEFLLGTFLAVAGILAVPFAAFGSWEPEPSLPSTARSPDVPPRSGGGGLVLIGPIPIFFGSWRSVSPRTKALVAAVGAALLLVAVLLVLGRA